MGNTVELIENKRKYDKLNNKINKDEFINNSTSGLYTLKQFMDIYLISKRQFYFLCKKYSIIPKIIRSTEHITEEYKEKISSKLLNYKRPKESIMNYVNACKKRLNKNNKPVGTYFHSNVTKEKIKNSNIKTYSNNLPPKWIDSCILNSEWRKKLSIASKGKAKSIESIKKQIETKTGMSYEEYKIKKSDYYKYNRLVKKITNRQPINMINGHINKGKGYHLDHIVSISYGWYNKIDPEIIGHYCNLRYIIGKENMSKNKKIGMSVELLMEKYKNAKHC